MRETRVSRGVAESEGKRASERARAETKALEEFPGGRGLSKGGGRLKDNVYV